MSKPRPKKRTGDALADQPGTEPVRPAPDPVDATRAAASPAAKSGGPTPPDQPGASATGLTFSAFDLLARSERAARLVAQWREGRTDQDRLIVLRRSVPEDSSSLTIEELAALVPESTLRPRDFRAWDRAQVACDVIRGHPSSRPMVGLVPLSGRWRVGLVTDDGVTLDADAPPRRAGRALGDAEAAFRGIVAYESGVLDGLRAAIERGWRARPDQAPDEPPAGAEEVAVPTEADASDDGAGGGGEEPGESEG